MVRRAMATGAGLSVLPLDSIRHESKSLSDLARTVEGRGFLRKRGVYFDPNEFLERLEAPECPELADLLGTDRRANLVYTGQQIYADYPWSVISKLLTLNRLGEGPGIATCVLWSDIDRCGADEASTGFLWPPAKKVSARFVTKRAPGNDAETRFCLLDRQRRREVAYRLEAWIASSTQPAVDRRRLLRARERFRPVRDMLLDESLTTLRDLNGVLSGYFLEVQLGLKPRGRYVSEVLEFGAVKQAVGVVVNGLDAFVAAYNEGLVELLQQGVDPQLRPRGRAELPLFYSTEPPDGRRLRLYHEMDGTGMQFAVARTDSGDVHRFMLGGDRLTVDTFASTGRWSPDVSLVLFLDGLVSGVVAGRSSALYGIVLNRVRETLFGRTGVPVLVPDPMLCPTDYGFEQDSLFYSYLYNDARAAG